MFYADATIEEFRDNTQTKRIAIWGGGIITQRFLRNNPWMLEKINLIVDKDKTKHHNKCSDFEIYPVEQITKEEDVVCLIGSLQFQSVMADLEKMGFSGDIYSIYHLTKQHRIEDVSKLEEHMEELTQILCDDLSVKIIKSICNHRKNGELDYLDVYEPNQYFPKGIIKAEPDAVFIDGGAYNGDTVEQFLHFQNEEYDSIYCFEMDHINLELLQKNIGEKENVHILHYGLWDCEEELQYSCKDANSSVSQSEKGDYSAKCVSLDQILDGERISFLKMDIEGAEIKALHGAKKSILKWKPQLAICIYHNTDDLWQIPLLIHQWVPEYKLYIRHHSNISCETVLYAVL